MNKVEISFQIAAKIWIQVSKWTAQNSWPNFFFYLGSYYSIIKNFIDQSLILALFLHYNQGQIALKSSNMHIELQEVSLPLLFFLTFLKQPLLQPSSHNDSESSLCAPEIVFNYNIATGKYDYDFFTPDLADGRITKEEVGIVLARYAKFSHPYRFSNWINWILYVVLSIEIIFCNFCLLPIHLW